VKTTRPFDKLRVTKGVVKDSRGRGFKDPRVQVKITKEMRKPTPPHPCPLPQGERVKKGDFVRVRGVLEEVQKCNSRN